MQVLLSELFPTAPAVIERAEALRGAFVPPASPAGAQPA
jgi:hypothetical protein